MNYLPDGTLKHLREVADQPEIPGGRYEIQERIAQGGMGTVWKARDLLLERDVALKVLSVPQLTESARRRMLREARILASLEHPGIVPIHDLGTLPDGRTWYAMKRVEGDRLDVHVRGIPELSRRLAIFERICEAVAFAHAHDVIHRDLKPENIMVGSFGEVLVMDWGVAKIRESDALAPGDAEATQAMEANEPHSQADAPTQEMEPPADPRDSDAAHHATNPGTVLGTPGYMAPEQAAGRAHLVDERSDVYALGALLTRVVSPQGEPMPRRLDAIRRQATAERPEDRYPTARALAGDISRFLAGGAVSAYRDSLWERLLRLGQRHRTAILLVGVYVVVRALMFFFART